MTKKFTVEKGKSYEAKLRLTGWETAATNDMLREKFADLGFSHVKVTGSDAIRIASGTWLGEAQTVPMPSQVIRAKEVTVETASVTANATPGTTEAPKVEEVSAKTEETTEEDEPKKKASPYFTGEPPIGGFKYGEDDKD